MTAKAGEVITFTNTSQNATSYSWNFGNGKTSTLTNPTHSYSSAGNYTITLTATGNGGENSTSKTVEITAPALVGKWILAEGSFNTVMIASLTGYFKIVDAVKYEAQFSNGTYSGDVVANYTIAGTTFKSALNGQSFLLNGTTSSYTCCPMSVIWRTTMICSSTVFNQWGKTAIGYGEPKIEIIGSQLVITSSDGKTILKYNKE
jgi:PKD repeat protein